MINKLSSTFLIACFLFSMVFIAAGCAKKAPVAPAEQKAESPEEEETQATSQTFEEETVFEPSRRRREVEEPADEGAAEFKEMQVASTTKVFEQVPSLMTIHFDFDRYTIRAGDREVLNENAAWLNSNPDVFTRIEGHCDERGTSDYNIALGDKRADATKNYLVSLGVDSSRISIVTYGEERPICFGKNESCWSQNRRAEFLMAK